jgi:hypothetical protein
MKQFDILLVLGHFRAASAYLSIIRYLRPDVRIGLLEARVATAYTHKTVDGQASFIDLCTRFGAEIVRQGEPVAATLMIVQQYPYPAETAAEINASVRAARRVVMLGFATAGLEKHDSCLAMFDLRRAYVPSRRFMDFLLDQRGTRHRFNGMEVTQVGLPFRRYPVFPEFSADYVVAAPTLFSFRSERGKHQFLESVAKLLAQIPPSASVLYKFHNSLGRDYFAPPMRYAIAKALHYVPGALAAVARLSARGNGRISRHLQTIHTGALHLGVTDRTESMARHTEYPDIALEAFLPGVRGGVIGGLSNTIWGTLHAGIPYYNCIDPSLREGPSELLPNRSSDLLLDTNIRYFGVPFCEGDLARGALGAGIVDEQERDADLLAAVRADLATS